MSTINLDSAVLRDGTDVATFFVLATSITWACWMPNAVAHSKGRSYSQFLHFIGGIGPISAAAAVTYYGASSTSTSDAISAVCQLFWPTYRLCAWRVLLIAFCVPLLTSVITRLLYKPPQSTVEPSLMPFGFLMTMLIIPMEEIGWRSFALPRVLRLTSALLRAPESTVLVHVLAAVVIGVWWCVWHTPLFFYCKPHLLESPKETLVPAMASYAFGLSAMSLLDSRMLEVVGYESILPAVVAHASLNGSVGAVMGMNKGLFGWWFVPYSTLMIALTFVVL